MGWQRKLVERGATTDRLVHDRHSEMAQLERCVLSKDDEGALQIRRERLRIGW
jgi:hypothetical protein